MALHLARRKQRLPSNPSLIQLFSTSSSDPPPQDGNASGENPSQSSSSSSPSQSSFASYFGDVKDSLKQKTLQQQNGRRPFAITLDPASFTFSGNQSGGASTSILDIKRNLREFGRRSPVPPPGDSAAAAAAPQSQPQISFQELYKRNVASSSGDSSADLGPRKFAENFSAIRDSLKQLAPRVNATSSTEKKGQPLSGFQNILKAKPNENLASNVIGGAEAYSLPISVFGKEMEERKAEKGKEGEAEEMKTAFVKSYSADELGEKLRTLRPGGKKEEGWFSLRELNERLIKLRQWEEKEAKSTVTGLNLRSMMEVLRKDEEGKKKASFQRFDILSLLGGTNPYMVGTPKQHLLDTYFHPDNMSSAEKMKLELAKVREEFKKSESDCGSSLVQVAQLTVKIKHLSSVLHKKDKHSRKGLVAMVQRRKKILKYMRRKEWDSYCIALSKLGLRDNPDYKN